MSLDHDLKALLTRTADAAGPFSPPPAGELRARARRRSRGRSLAAVVGAVVIVLAVSLVVALRPDRAHTPAGGGPHGFDPSQLPGPTGPVVTAAELSQYRWRNLPPAPIASRSNAAGVWTGTQLIVWGGEDYGVNDYADGAAYDPATKKWTTLPPSPLSARTDMAYAWAGGRLVIWGGDDGTLRPHRDHDGATYDPTTGMWTVLPRAPISAYTTVQAYAVGQQMVLLSGTSGEHSRVVEAAAYDPASNRWTRLPELLLPAPEGLYGVVGLGVGPDLFAWVEWDAGGQTGPSSVPVGSGVSSYVFARGAWSKVALTPPRANGPGQPLWTGHEMILAGETEYCGFCLGPPGPSRQHTEILTLSRAARQRLPSQASNYAQFVWTGGALLGADGGADELADSSGRSAAWSPRTDHWTELPQAPFTADGDPTFVWTGTALLVWGGDLSPAGPGGNLAVSGYAFGPP